MGRAVAAGRRRAHAAPPLPAAARHSFVAWRQQVRLMEALARFAEGQPVTRIARDLGYAAPSAFIAMLRLSMNRPPRGYLLGGRG
ncbi:MAG: helix-turn-helix domain-containing protein [Solimonas sp.]